MQIILAPVQSVLMICAYGMALYAVWWVSRKGVQWIQAYRSKQQALESQRIKSAQEQVAAKAQDESDKLKAIEGR